MYVGSQDRLYFASVAQQRGDGPRISICYWDLASDEVATWVPDARMANGIRLSCDERCLLVCEQGDRKRPAAIARYRLVDARREVIVDDCTATPFNSPNKVVEPRPGAYVFTDPDYGPRQGFRPRRYPPATYSYDGEVLRKLTTGLLQPHGLALAPDGRALYISDTAADDGTGGYDPALPHSIHRYALDLDALTLGDGKRIASVPDGIPDGMGCDSAGRLYAATGDGVRVYDDSGELLHHYPIAGGAVNLWLDEPRGRLFATTDEDIQVWALA